MPLCPAPPLRFQNVRVYRCYRVVPNAAHPWGRRVSASLQSNGIGVMNSEAVGLELQNPAALAWAYIVSTGRKVGPPDHAWPQLC